jgi:amidophosphoribosyltransferase
MCGVVGLVAQSNVNQDIYDALTILQHRGQDAAGIATCHGGQLFLRKNNGLVRDVFRADHMTRLQGRIGIGHVRYPTAGSCSGAEAQPFYVNSPYGVALAHNGNLTNSDELRQHLFETDRRHINTGSDSEVLLNILAHELQKINKDRVDEKDVFEAIRGVHKRCRGSYATVAMITGYGIVGFTDPHGIRPLAYGRRITAEGDEWMIASETVALTALGFSEIREVGAGCAVVIDKDGHVYHEQCIDNPHYTPCIFEYVYLARPDSTIGGVSVYQSRLRMGEKLADNIRKTWPDYQIDVVIPIPDTSRPAALTLANRLGIPFREGLVKNRYIGRTFIMPGQQQRKKSVRQKLSAIREEFEGKSVLLVDDSIVRGTTSRQLIDMAREAGAKKVYFASAAPPVRYPNVYGIDMPAAEELIAHGKTEAEIAIILGADKLFYQTLDDLLDSVRFYNPQLTEFECSVFDGKYVTGDVNEAYLKKLEQKRSDNAKRADTQIKNNLIDLSSQTYS